MLQKKRKKALSRSQLGFLWAFGIPTLLLYIYICIVPMLSSVMDSFYQWSSN